MTRARRTSPSHPRRRRRVHLAAVVALLLGAPLLAREVYELNIEPQPLATALQQFARQSGLQIVYYAQLAENHTAAGVVGVLTAAEALERLLANTGLQFEAVDEHTVAIRPLREAARGGGRSSARPPAEPPLRLTQVHTAAPATAEAAPQAAAADPASPREEAPLARQQEIGEIIVTAQRREQRAVDVGISLNVFDQQTLHTRRLAKIEDLARLTPGLDTFEGNGTNNPTLTLRGVGTTNPFLNNNPSVAIYADEVYLPFSSFLTLPFFDLERLEVLKGPQVALYGRNATAGAVNVIPARPGREWSSYVDLSYARYDLLEARAAVGGPLGATVQMRLAGIVQDGGGYLRRPGTIGSTAGFTRSASVPGVPAVPAETDYGNKDVYALRATLAWQPAERAEFTFSAHYGEDRSELAGSTNTNGDRLRVFTPPSDAPLVDYDNVSPATDTEQYGVIARAQFNLGAAILTSVSGYHRIDRRYAIGDFVPTRIAEASFDENIRAVSQELRLTDAGSGSVRWLVGASYNDEKIDYARELVSYDFLLGALGTAFIEDDRAWAVYGDAQWELHPRWFFGAGLRYTDEDKQYRGGTFNVDPFGVSRMPLAFPQVGTAGLFGSPSYAEEDLSGKLSLDFKPSEATLLYVSVNRGFKSGGFDGSGVTVPSGFEPYGSEKIWAYELGFKAGFGPVDFSAAGFFYDYTDKQVLALLDLGNGITEAVIQNAAAAEVSGVELEVRWRPFSGLSLLLNGTVLDSEVTEFVSADPNETAARVGNELPGTPRKQLTAALDYTRPLNAGLVLDFALWGNYVEAAFRDIENTEALKSEARAIANARLALSRPAAGWNVYVYADNVFDRRYVTAVRSLVGMLGSYYGPPRTVGAGLRYEF